MLVVVIGRAVRSKEFRTGDYEEERTTAGQSFSMIFDAKDYSCEASQTIWSCYANFRSFISLEIHYLYSI